MSEKTHIEAEEKKSDLSEAIGELFTAAQNDGRPDWQIADMMNDAIHDAGVSGFEVIES